VRRQKKEPKAVPGASPRYVYLGGRLALDFVNTVHSAPGAAAALGDQGDWEGLVEFLSGAHVITSERVADLLAWRQSAPQVLPALMEKVFRLRAAIRLAFESRIAGAAIPEAAVEPINEILRITEGHDELAWEAGEWRLEFRAREESIEWLLAAIARSAAEIIAEGPGAPLRKCANPGCVLLFYDTSRTGRRRWCSMSVCGNRSKVAAFARRHSLRKRSA
jgi:predicted RNA-binding Zn ribbon-like protein